MTASGARAQGRMARLLRAPLLHFALIGGVLFLASRHFGSEAPEADIFISASEIETLRDDWQRQTGRAPDAREQRALIDARIDDELLLREAREMGWHRSDAVIQRRLIQNQRFLTPDDGASEAERLRRAFEQGMDRSDLVVRRRLLERMKLWIASEARNDPPSDAELEAHHERHAARFARPERVRLSQIFLSRDRHGDALAAEAARLAAVLEGGSVAPAEAASHSDPFLLANDLPLSSREELGRRFGWDFADGAMRARDAGWTGPIPSSYGVHFVWIHERVKGGRRPFEEVRAALRADWMRQREGEILRERHRQLRAAHTVEIESEGGGPRGLSRDADPRPDPAVHRGDSAATSPPMRAP